MSPGEGFVALRGEVGESGGFSGDASARDMAQMSGTSEVSFGGEEFRVIV